MSNLKEQWWKFHKDNPHVYELFSSYAFKAINTGRKHYSSRTIIELIRWHNYDNYETRKELLWLL